MSRPYSQYSQPAYQSTSPQYGGYADNNPTSPSRHNSRYDPDPNEYDNPFHNEAQYDREREQEYQLNRGYTDDQFNVASDFNNEGPRYGELYGGQSRQEMAQLAAGTRPMSS
jgi:hypothetical protein